MEYSSSRSPSPATIHRRSLVHELQRGHLAAEQLRRRLIRDPLVEDPAPVLSDIDLAEAILNSFNNSLSIATNSDPSVISSRLRSDDCKIEVSGSGDGGGESLRIRDRRGCYKRRKRGQSWTVDGEVPAEDCYAWRKYGQKNDPQHQISKELLQMHTQNRSGMPSNQTSPENNRGSTSLQSHIQRPTHLQKPSQNPQIMIPSSSSPGQSDSSILLSFDTSYNNINSPFFPPSNNNSMPIKQELPTNTATQAMMNVMMAMNQSSPSDYNYLSSTTVGSDLAGDVISAGTYPGSASPHSLEIDNYINHLDFIQFDCDINV